MGREFSNVPVMPVIEATSNSEELKVKRTRTDMSVIKIIGAAGYAMSRYQHHDDKACIKEIRTHLRTMLG